MNGRGCACEHSDGAPEVAALGKDSDKVVYQLRMDFIKRVRTRALAIRRISSIRRASTTYGCRASHDCSACQFTDVTFDTAIYLNSSAVVDDIAQNHAVDPRTTSSVDRYVFRDHAIQYQPTPVANYGRTGDLSVEGQLVRNANVASDLFGFNLHDLAHGVGTKLLDDFTLMAHPRGWYDRVDSAGEVTIG